MRESSIDRKFVRGVEALGGVTIKLSALGRYGAAGWPDRLVLMPGGAVCFVELKAPGKSPTPRQLHRIAKLHSLSFYATWSDNADAAVRWVCDVAKKESAEELRRRWLR